MVVLPNSSNMRLFYLFQCTNELLYYNMQIGWWLFPVDVISRHSGVCVSELLAVITSLTLYGYSEWTWSEVMCFTYRVSRSIKQYHFVHASLPRNRASVALWSAEQNNKTKNDFLYRNFWKKFPYKFMVQEDIYGWTSTINRSIDC